MRYRPDITALRAIAVLPVVAFHLGTPVFTGGYVGVDVFFVISGFLITRMIADDIAADTFTIARFYERRVRRIFPALFVMMAVVAVASYITLMPPELKNFGESLASTAAFSSNLMFWYQGMDYFDGPADLKPLLHTWSLSVEEQFYIVFPLFMVLVKTPRARLVVLTLTAVASLGLSQHLMQLRPASAFYLPQCRCWELLLGALISLAPRKGAEVALRAKWVQPLGFLAIAAPVLTYTSDTSFPGIAALPPALGAAAILYSGEQLGPRASALYAWRPVRFFGDISYSLYLWHWPIIVLYKYAILRDLGPADMVLIFGASVLAATASYYLIENPVRRTSRRRTFLFSASAAGILIFIVSGSLLDYWKGVPSRFVGYAPPSSSETSVAPPVGCWGQLGDTGNTWPGAACAITAGQKMVILWGDSFALHYIAGMEREQKMFDSRILLLARSGCPPLIGFDHPLEPSCRLFNDNAVRYISKLRPEAVILSARWIYNALSPAERGRVMADLQETIEYLDKLHINVLVIGQSPSFRFKSTYDYLYRLKRAGISTAKFIPQLEFSSRFQADLAQASVSAHFFDPMPVLCPGYRCTLLSDGQFLSLDGGHLTPLKSTEVVNAILREDCSQKWHIFAARCDIAPRD